MSEALIISISLIIIFEAALILLAYKLGLNRGEEIAMDKMIPWRQKNKSEDTDLYPPLDPADDF